MKGLSSSIEACCILLSLNSNSSEITASIQVILLTFKRIKFRRFNQRMHHKGIPHQGIFS